MRKWKDCNASKVLLVCLVLLSGAAWGAETGASSVVGNSASEADSNGSRQGKRENILASENGGHLLVATSDAWSETIDGKADYRQVRGEAVYAFKGEAPARFDKFTVLIDETNDANVKEFELLWSNDSPLGEFTSIGRFETTNAMLFKTPYQEFSFPPIAAKYFKVRLISSWGSPTILVYEFQLWGKLQ